MGVKGLTSYVRFNFGSLFRKVDLSASPSVLVVDHSALVHHIYSLIEAAGFSDNEPAAAFSFTRAYLAALEKAGVQHICYVYDGLQPFDGIKADEQNERAMRRVVERANFVSDPSNLGVQMKTISSSYTTIKNSISAAMFWVHRYQRYLLQNCVSIIYSNSQNQPQNGGEQSPVRRRSRSSGSVKSSGDGHRISKGENLCVE